MIPRVLVRRINRRISADTSRFVHLIFDVIGILFGAAVLISVWYSDSCEEDKEALRWYCFISLGAVLLPAVVDFVVLCPTIGCCGQYYSRLYIWDLCCVVVFTILLIIGSGAFIQMIKSSPECIESGLGISTFSMIIGQVALVAHHGTSVITVLYTRKRRNRHIQKEYEDWGDRLRRDFEYIEMDDTVTGTFGNVGSTLIAK